MDMTAPDKIGMSIEVSLSSVDASVPGDRCEDDASCPLVRSEEYPLYFAVCVAACVVEWCYSEYCECYVEAEHAAVYGTVSLSDGKCAATGLCYPAAEDEGACALFE